MDPVIQILKEFPAIWAFLGAVISSVLTFIITKRTGPIYAGAMKDLQVMHNDMVSGYKTQIVELSAERNSYREQLHRERDLHQVTMAKLSDLESRPNVDQVYKGQQEFFTKMSAHMDEQTKALQAISKWIMNHELKT
jgi:hypothetical protein